MNSLTKAEKFLNTVKLTPEDDLFVGVDVHKKSYHVALYLNDAAAIDFVMPAKKEQLTQKLKMAMPALRQVTYETGPCGYGLARHLSKNNLPISVAATSKILKLPGHENKTDRIDSRKLAKYAAKGLLVSVKVPTPKQEANRQLYRMRHRQARNLAKVKTQIKSFLLMHDIDEPAGLGKWQRNAIEQLKRLPLLKTLRLSLDELLGDMEYYESRVRTLNKTLAEHLNKGLLAQQIAILKTHPGVGTVVACQFATELFHYRDFNNTRQVYQYLGLSPRIRQSGDRSSSGPINRASNPRLRSNLLQAAWRWIAVDTKAKMTYHRLLNNSGGIAQKAVIAMTRKLSGHLWTMMIKDQPYDPGK